MELLNEHFNCFFLALLGLCFILARIPYIGKYIKVINTLIHETGHSLMTLFTDGQVIKVELFSDTSGTTVTKSKSKFGQFMIAFSGYPFASVVGFLFALLVFNGYFNAVLLTIATIAFINILFFVRNAHGIFWIITFITLVLLNLRFGNNFTTMCFAIVVSAITLFESLWSSIVLTKLSISKSKSAGDATNLSKLTAVPAFIWALIFLSISTYFVYRAVILFWANNLITLQQYFEQ